MAMAFNMWALAANAVGPIAPKADKIYDTAKDTVTTLKRVSSFGRGKPVDGRAASQPRAVEVADEGPERVEYRRKTTRTFPTDTYGDRDYRSQSRKLGKSPNFLQVQGRLMPQLSMISISISPY